MALLCLVVVLALLAALSSATLLTSPFPRTWTDFAALDSSNATALYSRYAKSFQKAYASHEDEARHFAVFADNIKTIFNWNDDKSGSHTYVKGITVFTDLSDEERARYVMPSRDAKESRSQFKASSATPLSKPLNIAASSTTCDLRPFTTSVKNQGSCGSCWAFGTMAAAEGAHFLWSQVNSDGVYPDNTKDVHVRDAWQLAEQVLLECCDDKYDAAGCGGGGAAGPMQCAVDIATLPSTTTHPYLATDKAQCQYSKTQAGAVVESFYQPCDFADEACIKSYIGGDNCNSFGTVAWKTSIEVVSSFYDYVDGVYSDPNCPNTIHNHAVAIVGWGTDAVSGKDYWIVRNSWGPSWGQNGYILMERGSNMCCIACDNLFFQ